MKTNFTTITKRALILTAIAASLSLAACGGGGGSSDSGTPSTGSNGTGNSGNGSNGSGNSNTATISLLTPAGAAASSFTSTGDVVNDSFAYANNLRAQLGLPALKYVTVVGTAAQNHALYMQSNMDVGHYETLGLPNYTGNSPTDRVKAVGYTTNSVGEIAAGIGGSFTSSTEAMDALFDAPFHRGIFLFDSTGVGVGQGNTNTDPSKYSTLVADFVDYVASTPDNKLVAYPYDGQKNVKAVWNANESPNPLATKRPDLVGKDVGYPVTLSAAGNGAFSNVVFAITDASGNAVDCVETDNSNAEESTRLAMCVPTAVMAYNTTYKVTVTGSLTNTTITTATPFSVSWSFTTASSKALTSNTSPAPTVAASNATTAAVSAKATTNGAVAPTILK